MEEIEAEVIELKPKALIVGAGLHFVKENLNHWGKYKEHLRIRLNELVYISKKVIEGRVNMHNVGHFLLVVSIL